MADQPAGSESWSPRLVDTVFPWRASRARVRHAAPVAVRPGLPREAPNGLTSLARPFAEGQDCGFARYTYGASANAAPKDDPSSYTRNCAHDSPLARAAISRTHGHTEKSWRPHRRR